MEIKYINQASDILYNSRIQLKKIKELPSECTPQNMEEAYEIQNSLIKKYLLANKNENIIGKKIGCTNKAAQDQLNITEPFYGNIFSNYSSKSNCTINADNFFSPFVEPEFSFKIKNELNVSGAPYTSKEVYKYIDSVLPSIELVDARYTDWTTIGINNLIADNAANAYWIYGNEIKDLDSFDFSNYPVLLYINDKISCKGNAKNVLDNPINSLTWLINTLASKGDYLPKDSYISTGTCTPAKPIRKGDKVYADFGKLGKVEFTFS